MLDTLAMSHFQVIIIIIIIIIVIIVIIIFMSHFQAWGRERTETQHVGDTETLTALALASLSVRK